ncbi:MAG: hypothetical protein NTU58_01480 [Candidatus Nealsonbacteria bacterium]|nr:hypothetical protein [Candidatus Nealsonbacteria bacterium]
MQKEAKEKIKNLKSLVNFKNELKETRTLIHALETQVIATKEFLKVTKAKEKPGYEKFQKFLEITDKQIAKLHELGFVALFANFECFMFEFLKDLFRRHTHSFQSDKIAKFEDIKDFKTVKEVKEYFIDSFAIEKSYDIETWTSFLNQRFGIIIFKNRKDLLRFKALNSIRNLILHSGSKTNVKFRNEMRNLLKTPVPIGKPFKLDMKRYFVVLHSCLQILIKNIEKS